MTRDNRGQTTVKRQSIFNLEIRIPSDFQLTRGFNNEDVNKDDNTGVLINNTVLQLIQGNQLGTGHY